MILNNNNTITVFHESVQANPRTECGSLPQYVTLLAALTGFV